MPKSPQPEVQINLTFEESKKWILTLLTAQGLIVSKKHEDIKKALVEFANIIHEEETQADIRSASKEKK